MKTVFYQLLTLALVLFNLAASEPQWYTTNDGTRYLIKSTQSYNWLQAYDECARRGLQLAVFDTQTKINNFDTLLRRIFATSPNLWLGIQDEFNTKRDKSRPFYAMTTGEKLSVSNWDNHQPDNANGAEHCALIGHNTGFKWNDISCEAMSGILCEENSFTTSEDMEEKRQKINQKNSKVSSDFSGIQTQIKQINGNTRSKTDSILDEFRNSTDEIVANLKQSIKEIILKKPYMEAVIADLGKSINAVVLENEQEFAKVSDEVRQSIEDVHLSAESSTNEVTSKFSLQLTTNTNDIDQILVY